MLLIFFFQPLSTHSLPSSTSSTSRNWCVLLTVLTPTETSCGISEQAAVLGNLTLECVTCGSHRLHFPPFSLLSLSRSLSLHKTSYWNYYGSSLMIFITNKILISDFPFNVKKNHTHVKTVRINTTNNIYQLMHCNFWGISFANS